MITQIILFVIIAAIALCVGIFVYRNPQKTFEIQAGFYRMINWKIEPISLEKEIRNTKVMGLFLIGFTLIMSIYFVCQNF